MQFIVGPESQINFKKYSNKSFFPGKFSRKKLNPKSILNTWAESIVPLPPHFFTPCPWHDGVRLASQVRRLHIRATLLSRGNAVFFCFVFFLGLIINSSCFILPCVSPSCYTRAAHFTQPLLLPIAFHEHDTRTHRDGRIHYIAVAIWIIACPVIVVLFFSQDALASHNRASLLTLNTDCY